MLINCYLAFYLNTFCIFVLFLFEKWVILQRSTGSVSVEDMLLKEIICALRYKCAYINIYILICVQLDLKVNEGKKSRCLSHDIWAYFSMKCSKNSNDVSRKIMSHIGSFLFPKCIPIYTLLTDCNLFMKLKFHSFILSGCTIAHIFLQDNMCFQIM